MLTHEGESGAIPDIIVLNDQGGGIMSVSDKPNTLRAQMKHHEPIICYAVKTKQIDMRTEEGIAHPLDSNDDKEPQAVCYKTRHDATCVGSEPSLPLYVLEGNGSRESHQGPGYAVGDTMYTLNTVEQHAVCYAIEGHVVDRNTRNNGKGWCVDVSPTLNTQDRHAVCYAVDCRNGEINSEISCTIQAHCSGGWSVNTTNPVLYEGNNG